MVQLSPPHPTVSEQRGMMLVLSSPSGAGKTSLSRRLLELDPKLGISISATTRPMRPREVEGRDYFFMSEDHFQELKAAGEFLESATVFGHHYGSRKSLVEKQMSAGQDVLFDIDWQGTQQLAAGARPDLVSVFILPPSLEELRSRLLKRAQDTAEVVDARMKAAAAEMSHWAEYDYVIINRDFDNSIEQLLTIVRAERLKRYRQPGMTHFVRELMG